MSPNATRISSGGQIQVKVGVLQGIGPIGQTGRQGERGIQGEQGAQGEVGPMGQIAAYMSRFDIGSSVTLPPSTDVLLGFDTIIRDELHSRVSSTAYEPAINGDFTVSVWLACGAAVGGSEGTRDLWFTIDGGTIARTTIMPNQQTTYMSLSWPYRFIPSDTLQVMVRSGDNANCTIAAGSLVLTRHGSGPQGPIGLTGVQGPIGPEGPMGPQGDPGSAGSGFATYADLL
jgi:hypothetical protein